MVRDYAAENSPNQGENSDLAFPQPVTDYSAGMEAKSQDQVRKRLRDIIGGRRDLSLGGLSEAIGKKRGYLSDFLNKYSPSKLDYLDAVNLARRLGVTVAELGVEVNLGKDTQPPVVPPMQGSVTILEGRHDPTSWPRDIPILGHVRAGVEGFFLDQGQVLGMTHRPPNLQGVYRAFAVAVRDESMVPSFRPGWLAWVHPSRRAVAGEDVVVELHDGQAFIKELVRRTEKQVICKQWHPEKEVRYELGKVKNVYYVAWRGPET